MVVHDPVLRQRLQLQPDHRPDGEEVLHVEIWVDPGGGVTPHVHPAMEERFEVLAGSPSFLAGRRWRTRRARRDRRRAGGRAGTPTATAAARPRTWSATHAAVHAPGVPRGGRGAQPGRQDLAPGLPTSFGGAARPGCPGGGAPRDGSCSLLPADAAAASCSGCPAARIVITHLTPTKSRRNSWLFRSATPRPTSRPTRPRARSASTTGSATPGPCCSRTRRTSPRSARPSSATWRASSRSSTSAA